MGNQKDNLLELISSGGFVPNKTKQMNETINEETNQLLKEFKEKKENNLFVQLSVTGVDNEGNLYIDTGSKDVTGIVFNEDVTGEEYNPYSRSAYVGKTFIMLITKVDEENATVYFNIHKAREASREIFRNYLIEELEKGNKPIVNNCIVTGFGKPHKRVFLSLGGLGLFGFIPIANWKYGYVYNLQKEIPKSMSVSVQVTEYKPKTVKNGRVYKEYFLCSRKAILPNPWEGIEERVPKGTILKVTCTHTRHRNWFGVNPLLDMDVLCNYPNDDKNIRIEPGKKYKVLVYAVNESAELLRAKVLSEII